jgi:hypothetical protein
MQSEIFNYIQWNFIHCLTLIWDSWTLHYFKVKNQLYAPVDLSVLEKEKSVTYGKETVQSKSYLTTAMAKRTIQASIGNRSPAVQLFYQKILNKLCIKRCIRCYLPLAKWRCQQSRRIGLNGKKTGIEWIVGDVNGNFGRLNWDITASTAWTGWGKSRQTST